MDEQQQVARRRRSCTEVEELVDEYQASGLTRTEFCRRNALSLSTLNRYLKRRRELHPEGAGLNLIAVELSAGRPTGGKSQDSGLAIALATGRRIEVARGFDAPTLLQLLGLLERF